MKDLKDYERTLHDLTRLSETVSRELGSCYAEVVQSCLQASMGIQGLYVIHHGAPRLDAPDAHNGGYDKAAD